MTRSVGQGTSQTQQIVGQRDGTDTKECRTKGRKCRTKDITDNAVSNKGTSQRTRYQTKGRHTQCGIKQRDVTDNAVSNKGTSHTMRYQTKGRHTQCGIKQRDVTDTVVSNKETSQTMRYQTKGRHRQCGIKQRDVTDTTECRTNDLTEGSCGQSGPH